LGDCVVSAGVLKPLVERYAAKTEITWCVKREYLALWEKVSAIQPMALEELGTFFERANGRGNTAVFLNPERALEARAKQAGYRVFSWGKTLPDTRKHCKKPEAAYCADLLEAAGFPIGIPARPWLAPRARAPQNAPQKPYVLIHAGAFGQKPSLCAATVLALSEALAARGLAIVWAGLDTRREEGAGLMDAAGKRNILALGAALPMEELVGWLAGARGVIGRDSGLSHLAAALGTPTVALVGPLAKKLAARRWGLTGAKATTIELPMAPLWFESDRRYQRRYFDAVKTMAFIETLEALWR